MHVLKIQSICTQYKFAISDSIVLPKSTTQNGEYTCKSTKQSYLKFVKLVYPND